MSNRDAAAAAADHDPLDAKRHGIRHGIHQQHRMSGSDVASTTTTTATGTTMTTTKGHCPLVISSLLWDGGTLTKIPFHTIGVPRRRYLRLRRIGNGGSCSEQLDGGDEGDDGGKDNDSSYAFRTPPSIKKKHRRRNQIHSADRAGNSACGIGRRNANKYNSIEVCVATPAGQSSIANSSNSTNRLHLASMPLCLEWFDPGGGDDVDSPGDTDGTDGGGRQRLVHLRDVLDITPGHATPAFRAYQIRHQHFGEGGGRLPDASLCFSIVTHQRTLDLAADSVHEARRWIVALQSLVEHYETWNGGNSATRRITSMPKRSRVGNTPRQRISSPISRLAPSPDLNDSFTSVGSNGSVTDTTEWNAAHNEKVFHAARTGSVQSLVAYIDRDGCPIDVIEGSSGDTPLLLACRLGHAHVVDLCLKRGAHNDPHPSYGQTALQAAVSSGHASCVKLLLETAAVSGADSIIANHEVIGAKDPTRREAPIHTAARVGNLEIVELLVLHGANLGLVDSSGRTSLHCAAAAGHSAILKLLLDFGGDVFIEQMNDVGMSCLHLAIENNRMECVRALLEFAADVDERAMDLATGRRLGKIVALLQAYCAVNARATADGGYMVECQDDASVSSRRSSISTVTFDLPRPDTSKPHTAYASRADSLQRAMQQSCNGLRTDKGGGGSSSRRLVRRRSTNAHTPSDHREPLKTPSHYFTPASTQQSEPRINTQPQCDPRGWSSPVPIAQVRPPPTPIVPPTPAVVEGFQLGPMYWQTYHEPGSNRLFFVRYSDGHSQWEDPRLPASAALQEDDGQSPSSEVFRTPMSSPEPQVMAMPTRAPSSTQTKQIMAAESAKEHGDGPVNENDCKTRTNELASAESDNPDPREAMLQMIRARGSTKLDDRISDSKASAEIAPDPRKAMLAMIRARSDPAISDSSEDQRESAPNPRHAMLAMIKARSKEDTSAGIDSTTSSVADSSDNVNSDDVSDEARQAITKYKRMLQMQVPAEAVRHEMKKQGHLEAHIISAVFGSLDDAKEKSGEEETVAHDESTQHGEAPTKEGAAKDLVLAQFALMVKVGVPVLSAVHKMTQEGIDEDKIVYFKRAYGIQVDDEPNIASKKRKAANPPSISPSTPQPRVKRPGTALQRIHWTAVDKSKLEGSLWDAGDEEDLDDSAIRELEEVFAADAPAVVGMATPATQRKSKIQISLIDPRRAQNVAIQLAQFKSFASDDDIVSSVSSFTADQLLILTSILPTADERATVKSFDGNSSCLGRAEQFFVAVSQSPRLPSRLRSFLFMRQFDTQASELEQSLILLATACKEVVRSAPLKSMLRRLLTVGNVMNTSAGRKTAAGITVDSLLKTATKRGRDKTTVVDHVVANLLKQGDSERVVEFASTISSTNKATHVDIRDAQATLKKMESSLRSVSDAIASETEVECTRSESDLLVDKGSQFVGQAASRIDALKSKLDAARYNTRLLYRFFAEEEDPKESRVSLILSTLSELASLVKQSKEGWVAKQKKAERKASSGDKSTSNVPATPTSRISVASSTLNRDGLLLAIKETNQSKSVCVPDRKALLSAIKNRPGDAVRRAEYDRSALLAAINHRRKE